METACLREWGKNDRSLRRLVNESADRLADEMRKHAREIEAARRIVDPQRRLSELRRLELRTLELRQRSAETREVARNVANSATA